MKKLLILPILFLLIAGTASAADVSRNMPSRVDPGSEVTITLTLTEAPIGEGVVIEDSFPSTISLTSWEISGSQEAKADVGYQKKESTKEGFDRHSWPFTAVSSSPSITYKIDAPTIEGDYQFEARWITSEGFSRASAILTVQTIMCGNGVCEQNENSNTCEVDCPKPAEEPEPRGESELTEEPVSAKEPQPEADQLSTEAPEPDPAKGSSRALIVLVIVVNLVVILGIVLFVVYRRKLRK